MKPHLYPNLDGGKLLASSAIREWSRVHMKQRTHGIYEKRSTSDLQKLVSQKKVALAKLEQVDSFFTRLEADKLRSQIAKIEVELTARFYQQQLPL